ncbi:unnamed protein product [Umbelopsis ramanniana]
MAENTFFLLPFLISYIKSLTVVAISSFQMKRLSEIAINDESDAAYMCWDEDTKSNKKWLIAVSNKYKQLGYKFEYGSNTIHEGTLSSYRSAGVDITSELENEKVWITATKPDGEYGSLAYTWGTNSLTEVVR